MKSYNTREKEHSSNKCYYEISGKNLQGRYLQASNRQKQKDLLEIENFFAKKKVRNESYTRAYYCRSAVSVPLNSVREKIMKKEKKKVSQKQQCCY